MVGFGKVFSATQPWLHQMQDVVANILQTQVTKTMFVFTELEHCNALFTQGNGFIRFKMVPWKMTKTFDVSNYWFAFLLLFPSKPQLTSLSSCSAGQPGARDEDRHALALEKVATGICLKHPCFLENHGKHGNLEQIPRKPLRM